MLNTPGRDVWRQYILSKKKILAVQQGTQDLQECASTPAEWRMAVKRLAQFERQKDFIRKRSLLVVITSTTASIVPLKLLYTLMRTNAMVEGCKEEDDNGPFFELHVQQQNKEDYDRLMLRARNPASSSPAQIQAADILVVFFSVNSEKSVNEAMRMVHKYTCDRGGRRNVYDGISLVGVATEQKAESLVITREIINCHSASLFDDDARLRDVLLEALFSALTRIRQN